MEPMVGLEMRHRKPVIILIVYDLFSFRYQIKCSHFETTLKISGAFSII